MSATVRKVIPEVAEVCHRFVVQGFETKTAGRCVKTNLLHNAASDLRGEILLSLNDGYNHALGDR